MDDIQKNCMIFDLGNSESDSPTALLLRELIDNGLAQFEKGKVFVPFEEICRLPTIDQKILNLPEPYPFDIRVDATCQLSDPAMKLSLGYYEYNHGSQLFGNRIGCIVVFQDDIKYLLSFEQYLLCEAVEEFNSMPSREFAESLIKFSQIRNLSEKSAAILDSYLAKEKIIIPEKISLKLEKDGEDNLSILPEISSIDQLSLKAQFERKFDKSEKIRKSYTLSDDDNARVRIPFSEKQRNELKKIKRYRKIKGELKNRILERPHEIFNPDIIDLENFSDRVIKIGLYKPKYFPFVSPYKSEWIPGIIVDSGDEKIKILVKDKKELCQLEEAYEESANNKKPTVNWKGKEIPINEAEELIGFTKKQLENPTVPVQKTDSKKKVLIIEDNLFEDKYQKYKKLPTPVPDTFSHAFKTPPDLKKQITLYDHQKEGVAWLESLFETNYPGGLLADDMGLGKTIQILSFINWHQATQNSDQKPYLIVAPLTLLENWSAEFNHFFDSDLDPIILHGNSSIIADLLLNKNGAKIFLTNYETVRNATNQLIFGQIDWAVVILDEAQKIKTPGTLVTNSIKALKADFKIAATGTPVENSMVDLWCIVDFVVPGLLGSAKDFSQEYQRPIRKNITDDELNQLGERLRGRIGLYFKRRLKDEILDNLPDKELIRETALMPEYQKTLYVQQTQNGHASDKQRILATILNLKKISDHPYLMGYNYQMISSQKLIENSAKLKVTIKILKEVKTKNEKAIIFAEFKETQRILQKVIQDVFGLGSVSIINGDMAARVGNKSQKETRQMAIDRFQNLNGFNIIIMSPLAAGLGLNVTAANHVIHYSRHWNPAKEAQATDRAYRIGQKKKVFVYFPIAMIEEFKTFDIIIDDLLKNKRNLADAAMFPSAICEVKTADIASETFGEPTQNPVESGLRLDNFDSFEPYFFEAAIACVFQKKGFDVTLTPRANDKGADVVALSNDRNYLIQVKQSKSKINDTCVGEILKAKGYYKNIFDEDFSLMVATNQNLNQNALMIAEASKVEIFDRSDLKSFLNQSSILFSEIQSTENNRCKQI